jgi:type I restriction enzyme S subunit
VSAGYANKASRYAASAGLVLIAMDGEFRAQFALELELPLHINQRVAMLTATGIRPELLTVWLNRIEGQHQLNQWAVKTTVEHTSLDHIGGMLVPRFNEDEEYALADRLLLARNANWYARSLTLLAQTLVEHLIDGRVTEADLVAAQKALEASERSTDREFLKALRRTEAPNAEPLIADVEALYALLDESEDEDA